MKKILVPTDFSSSAKHAHNAAFDIAERTGAELYFIHFHAVKPEVSHVPASIKTNYSEHEETQALVVGKLQLLVNEAEHRSIRSSMIPVFDLEDSLDKYIDAFGVDLVIMATHHTKSLRKMLTGSNTMHIIRNTHIPVLVVRDKTSAAFKKIVFAYNFEEDLVKPMKHIMEWVNIFGAELSLLFVNVPYNFRESNEILGDIKRFMHQFPGVSYTAHIYNAYNEERGIRQFLIEFQPDLLAMVTRGKTGLVRLLSQNIVEHVLMDETSPVLVINIGEV